jgi:hypothetical protein
VLVRAENEIFRTALLAAGRVAVLGVYNDIADMLLSSSALQRELYRDFSVSLAAWQMFAEMLRIGGNEERISFIEPLLASLDERVVLGYAATLGIAADQQKSTSNSPQKVRRTQRSKRAAQALPLQSKPKPRTAAHNLRGHRK